MKSWPLLVALVLVLAVALPVGAAPQAPGSPQLCDPLTGTWATVAPGLSTAVRAAGAWGWTNGAFYSLGGRTADGTGNDILNPREYFPPTNTWAAKTASFSDAQVNNMVAGVLDFGSGPIIVIVGGSAGGMTTATAETRTYDPVADTMTTLSSDPWPGDASGDTLPGGAAVYNNKLYVFGGFVINVTTDNRVWEFDPMAAAGSRWTQKTATLPVALAYIPAATLGNYIYLAGGSEYTGSLTDTNGLYRYDPVADSFATLTSMPTPTSNTKAFPMFGETMWVLGGGFVTTVWDVQVYDPLTDSWVAGPAMPAALRNFAAAQDPSNNMIFTNGGYEGGAPVDYTFAFTPCPPPTSVTVSSLQAASGGYGLWVLVAVVGLGVVGFALFRRARA